MFRKLGRTLVKSWPLVLAFTLIIGGLALASIVHGVNRLGRTYPFES
jgi:hypothetical protein